MSLLQNSPVGRADVAWLALDERPAPPPRSHRSNQSCTQNEHMTPPTLPGRTVLLAGLLALASVPALAEVDVLSMSSDARFTSVLKAPPPWSSAYSVTSAAEWIALGRHAQTATPAGQPVGSPFSVDNVQAWADFQQEDEGSSFHSYARLTGNYLDAGPWNFARNGWWANPSRCWPDGGQTPSRVPDTDAAARRSQPIAKGGYCGISGRLG